MKVDRLEAVAQMKTPLRLCGETHFLYVSFQDAVLGCRKNKPAKAAKFEGDNGSPGRSF